ncbi:MAG: flavodoxin domain-containing protein [Lactobacillales bacterium]|jgi:sulfite reductase (NADPH) flavoprotein alpha-component|nr:flavodoxin domain-containing protein [Lactobacillales bacterium]
MEIKVLFGSETGHAEELAQNTQKFLTEKGFSANVYDMDKVSLNDLKTAKTVLILTSTWGDGEAPSNAEKLHSALKEATGDQLTGVTYAVFAIGQSWYDHFCQAGIDFDAYMEKLGAKRILPLEKSDDDYDATHPTWLNALLSILHK